MDVSPATLKDIRARRDRLSKALDLLDPPDVATNGAPVAAKPAKAGLKPLAAKAPALKVTTLATARAGLKPAAKAGLKPAAKKAGAAATRAPRGEVKELVYEFVAAAPGPVSVGDVCAALDKPYTQVYMALKKDARIAKVDRGMFGLAEASADGEAAAEEPALPEEPSEG